MCASSDDPNTPISKPAPDSAGQPTTEEAAKSSTAGRRGQAAALAGKALPYLAVLAAAGAGTAQAGAAVPAPEQDRAYLEALLHGSWTQPPDLNAKRLPPTGAEIGPEGAFKVFGQAFNDSFNPHPTPYHDSNYGDSAFGDRHD
jgi:hypothetical protein